MQFNFLICRNVPIARIGDQDYLGSEIGLDGDEAGKVIPVHRNPEEVFSDATIASFEGKPVTNDHPPGIIGRHAAVTLPCEKAGGGLSVQKLLLRESNTFFYDFIPDCDHGIHIVIGIFSDGNGHHEFSSIGL